MLRWVGLALLGIVVAIVVAIVASNLASQQIGLASEPVSAGDALAPAAVKSAGRNERPARRHPRHGQSRPAPSRPVEPAPTPETTYTAPAPSPERVEPAEPIEPHGESEHGGADD